MSFYNRYGVTKIKEEMRDNLSISFDSGIPGIPDSEVGAVFLYTPEMDNAENHYHITLNRDQIEIIRDWCDDFLKEKDILDRFEKDLKNKL
jgi:hypothetical protein